MVAALTPQQTRDLVEHFGGQRAAGRAIGVSPSAIRYWLDPEWAERKRADVAARYEGLSGVEYSHLLLRHRRDKALGRRRQRTGGGENVGQIQAQKQ